MSFRWRFIKVGCVLECWSLNYFGDAFNNLEVNENLRFLKFRGPIRVSVGRWGEFGDIISSILNRFVVEFRIFRDSLFFVFWVFNVCCFSLALLCSSIWLFYVSTYPFLKFKFLGTSQRHSTWEFSMFGSWMSSYVVLYVEGSTVKFEFGVLVFGKSILEFCMFNFFLCSWLCLCTFSFLQFEFLAFGKSIFGL